MDSAESPGIRLSEHKTGIFVYSVAALREGGCISAESQMEICDEIIRGTGYVFRIMRLGG